MTRDEIDIMWNKALQQSIKDGEQFTRYHFAALVAAAKDAEHKEAMRWDIHSCGPTCSRYACVATREAVAAEREACARLCDEEAVFVGSYGRKGASASNCAAAIRARGQA